MANVFQATTGYRDPLKAMTLKALEARAKAAQEQMANSVAPQVVANPEQGIAGMLGVLSSGLNQNRVDSAAASGRQDLASVMAGIDMDKGPDMAQIARIGVRDPELAQRMYEQAMETRQANLNREDTQAFQSGESLLERQQREKLEADRNALTVSEGALQRGSAQSIATAGNVSSEKIATENNVSQEGIAGANRTSQEGINTADNDAAAARTAAEIKARADQDRYKQENDPDSPVGKITNDFNQGVYNIPGEDQSHPNTIKRYKDAIAAENAKDTPPAGPGSDYLKKAEQEAAVRHGKIVEGGATARTFVADIKRMGELGKIIGTGKEEEIKVKLGPYAEMLGIDIAGLGEAQAYEAIADKLAPTMRPEGSGSSSNYDAQQFLRALPNLGRSPDGNAVIQATFEALMQDRMNAAAVAQRALLPEGDTNRVSWQEVDKQIAALPDPFELYKQFAAKAGVGGGGGGGGGEPVKPTDIPQAEWDAMPPEDKALFQ